MKERLPTAIPEATILSQQGVALIIDFSSGTPQILHWGRHLGDNDIAQLRLAYAEPAAHAELDEYQVPGIWRENARGFLGRPTVLGHRSGRDFSQLFELVRVERSETSLSTFSQDLAAGLEVSMQFTFVGAGILAIEQSIRNIGDEPFSVEAVDAFLPLPDYAAESMDFSGRWIKERQPNRRHIQPGSFMKEVREGRSSHDYTIVQLAMTAGANFQNGEIWSMGVGFSGNSRHCIERQSSGKTFIAAGELLLPGEVILPPHTAHHTPTIYALYSEAGIDGLSDRAYRWLRSRPDHPSVKGPRPLTLNVWEAVYFDHNFEKLSALADIAQQIGVERFVLDDGWFGERRNDSKGLGDWQVSEDVWPSGLAPLIDKVRASSMTFGLWFEGEMLNPNSVVYANHPDWILKVEGRIPPEGRKQHVLDLTNPAAYQYVLASVSKIIGDYDINYIKWDHNKFLLEPASDGRPAVHQQTLAIYQLFMALKARHPGLEIESCASGGGRIDLGMAQIADRFWTSDCNDALERQYIQRYTQFVIPPEMLGSHIGPSRSHTTGRRHTLSFRAITALFGHAGLEWDLTQTSLKERQLLTRWATFYKRHRPLLHSGRMVRVDQTDETRFVHGVVAQDAGEALFALITLAAQAESKPDSICFKGLDPAKTYHTQAVFPAGQPTFVQRSQVNWFDGVRMSGQALMNLGLKSPIMQPENALLIHLRAVNGIHDKPQ